MKNSFYWAMCCILISSCSAMSVNTPKQSKAEYQKKMEAQRADEQEREELKRAKIQKRQQEQAAYDDYHKKRIATLMNLEPGDVVCQVAESGYLVTQYAYFRKIVYRRVKNFYGNFYQQPEMEIENWKIVDTEAGHERYVRGYVGQVRQVSMGNGWGWKKCD